MHQPGCTTTHDTTDHCTTTPISFGTSGASAWFELTDGGNVLVADIPTGTSITAADAETFARAVLSCCHVIAPVPAQLTRTT
jgi:hypothetical protein